MKKLFFSTVIASLIFGLTSCSKISTPYVPTDLTVDVIGVYTGTYRVQTTGLDTTFSSVVLAVTKIDTSNIRIESTNQAVTSPIKSSLISRASGTIGIVISQQDVNSSETAVGATTPIPSVNGLYTPTSKNLVYSVSVTNNSGTTIETFNGNKQ